MQAAAPSAPLSKKWLWAGRVISALIVVFLLFNSIVALRKGPQVVEGIAHLGYPDLARTIGILMLACTVLYAIPRTSIVGAILLTGYLGGATASHVRIGEPFWIPVVVGVLVWAGLYLRDHRVAALVPLRR